MANTNDIMDAPAAIVQELVFPISTNNATIAVTSSSQTITLPGLGYVVKLGNLGSTECFVAAGAAAITATAGGSATSASDGSMSLAPGEVGTFALPAGAVALAAITAAGTTTLRVSMGSGA